jgi:hypothetical protein
MIDLFRGFWWLPFPIAFCLYRAFQSWLSDRSNRETLDLNKTYAASEREPPPELLNRLSKRQNEVACYPQPRTAAGGSGRLQMTPDDQLSAFLGEQPATSRADLFAAVVMQKIERRAFLAQIVTAGGGAAVVGLIAWACAPALNVLIWPPLRRRWRWWPPHCWSAVPRCGDDWVSPASSALRKFHGARRLQTGA